LWGFFGSCAGVGSGVSRCLASCSRNLGRRWVRRSCGVASSVPLRLSRWNEAVFRPNTGGARETELFSPREGRRSGGAIPRAPHGAWDCCGGFSVRALPWDRGSHGAWHAAAKFLQRCVGLRFCRPVRGAAVGKAEAARTLARMGRMSGGCMRAARMATWMRARRIYSRMHSVSGRDSLER
jgi:hypothetical protein